MKGTKRKATNANVTLVHTRLLMTPETIKAIRGVLQDDPDCVKFTMLWTVVCVYLFGFLRLCEVCSCDLLIKMVGHWESMVYTLHAYFQRDSVYCCLVVDIRSAGGCSVDSYQLSVI